MMEKKRVAAYGDITYVVDYLNPKDIIFFSHKRLALLPLQRSLELQEMTGHAPGIHGKPYVS